MRASRPSSFKSDPTVLQFRLPTGSFGVAVEDVLTNDCVYLPDHGLFVTRDPAPITLADYKRKIAGRKTILQQVRELPDQTLAQAMARTHHDAQREGPVMLSLACDNTKFVLERDGTLRFQTTTNLTGDWFATAGAIQPQFGVGQGPALTRRLDGGWLPIPVITAEHKGVLYSERIFVAPCDEAGSDPARLNRRSVCVAEFTVTNTLAQPAEASLSLNFVADSRQKKAASLARCASGYCVADEAGPFALAATDTAKSLTASAQGGELKLTRHAASTRRRFLCHAAPGPAHRLLVAARHGASSRGHRSLLERRARAGHAGRNARPAAERRDSLLPGALPDRRAQRSRRRAHRALDCGDELRPAGKRGELRHPRHGLHGPRRVRPARAGLLHPPLQHQRLPHDRLHHLRHRLAPLDAGRALPALSGHQLAAPGRARGRARCRVDRPADREDESSRAVRNTASCRPGCWRIGIPSPTTTP